MKYNKHKFYLVKNIVLLCDHTATLIVINTEENMVPNNKINK